MSSSSGDLTLGLLRAAPPPGYSAGYSGDGMDVDPSGSIPISHAQVLEALAEQQLMELQRLQVQQLQQQLQQQGMQLSLHQQWQQQQGQQGQQGQ